MKRHAALAAICGAAALVAAAQSFAAGPVLSVAATTSALTASGSTVLRFADNGQEPVATIDVYSPAGFGIELDQPFGSTIGGIEAQATAAGANVRLTGAIKSADPTGYVQAAAACTPGQPHHDAIW